MIRARFWLSAAIAAVLAGPAIAADQTKLGVEWKVHAPKHVSNWPDFGKWHMEQSQRLAEELDRHADFCFWRFVTKGQPTHGNLLIEIDATSPGRGVTAKVEVTLAKVPVQLYYSRDLLSPERIDYNLDT